MKIPTTTTTTTKQQQQQQQQQNTNLKLYKSKEGKTITTFYTLCVKLSDEREEEKEQEV